MTTNQDNWHASGTAIRRPGGFGKRREPSTIIVNRNGVTRLYRISPLLGVACFSIAAMFLVGYLAATAYLFLRDDLIGMSQARNARLMHEYEDRIAALRANLDRVTSRQLLDQQAIEARVDELFHRQDLLSGRSSRIGKLIEAAHERGLHPAPAPQGPAGSTEETTPLTTGSIEGTGGPLFAGFGLRGGFDGKPGGSAREVAIASAAQTTSPHRDPFRGGPPAAALGNGRSGFGAVADISDVTQAQNMFTAIGSRIDDVEQQQKTLLSGLATAATGRSERIAAILDRLDIGVDDKIATDIGGPFVPLDARADFEAHVAALDRSLSILDTLSATTSSVPFANPVPGKPVSSRFGMRLDPFLKRAAMHSGIDFRAQRGTPVRAAGNGRVVAAGRNGGYGKMVEIDHGGGLTTRYAHLKRISVRKGETVEAGATIGKVGSTGRSTGPHLHYEIRRNGRAVDPKAYLDAGRELARLRDTSD